MFDPALLGGLLRAGQQRVMTGPGNVVDSKTILKGLDDDKVKLEIPVVGDRVRSITKERNRFLLSLDLGMLVEALAVVVATGSRLLRNELTRFGDGVFITYKGLSFLSDTLRQAVEHAGKRPVVVATNREVRALSSLFEGRSHDFVFLVPRGDARYLAGFPGRIVECDSWSLAPFPLTSKKLLVLTSRKGHAEEIPAGSVLLDYVSYQNRPGLPRISPRPRQRRPGLPYMDCFLESSVDGLFFAGDVTCRYASVASAIADGIVAGFGAYSHAYKLLFGRLPPLFAYRAGNDPAAFLSRELPVFLPTDTLEWLQMPPQDHPLGRCSEMSLAQACDATGLPFTHLLSLVEEAVRGKFMTVHRNVC